MTTKSQAITHISKLIALNEIDPNLPTDDAEQALFNAPPDPALTEFLLESLHQINTAMPQYETIEHCDDEGVVCEVETVEMELDDDEMSPAQTLIYDNAIVHAGEFVESKSKPPARKRR